MSTPAAALKAGLKSLFQNEQGSDLTEGANQVINLKAIGSDDDSACDDPEATKHMIHYFYHLDYQAGFTSDIGKLLRQSRLLPDSDEVMHGKVFAAAVKYQIPALKNLAAKKFSMAANANYNDSGFAQAVRIVYTTTAEDVRDLRDVVAGIITTHGSLLNRNDINAVVVDIELLAWELLRKSKGLAAAMPGQESAPELILSRCFECKEPVYESGCDCGRVCLGCGWMCCFDCS